MVAIALLGTIVGSFLNVVIHRLPRGESLVRPRSRCPECGSPVRPLDNVPLVSWLALRGRCRDCRASIPARYPLVELVTGAAFAAVVLTRGLGPHLAFELPFVAVVIAVAAVDVDHGIVPNKVLAPAAGWGVTVLAVIDPRALPAHLVAGAAAFGALLAVALIYPGGMGMGDVKLAGVMGLYLGSAVLPALLAAFLAGSLVGGAVILREGARARKRALPFAPFLAAGSIVGLLAGPELLSLYTSHFLT